MIKKFFYLLAFLWSCNVTNDVLKGKPSHKYCLSDGKNKMFLCINCLIGISSGFEARGVCFLLFLFQINKDQKLKTFFSEKHLFWRGTHKSFITTKHLLCFYEEKNILIRHCNILL